MIYRVTSSLPQFKTIDFQSGLNLVVAKKSADATDRQTRNGSGKSSLVRIINFLLGAKCSPESIFRYQSLEDQCFSLSFDLANERVTVDRTGRSASKLVVDGSFDQWNTEPKLDKDSGEYRIPATKWLGVLGHKMFGLDADLPKHSPTFRSMIGYFVRREASGAFHDAQRQGSMQQNWDIQVNLSYLLGLDHEVSRDLQLV